MARTWIAAGSFALVAACFSDPPPVDPEDATAAGTDESATEGETMADDEVNVGGMWRGTVTCRGEETPFTMMLVQVGSHISGTVDVPVWVFIVGASIDATIEDSVIEGEFVSGDVTTPFDAEVEGDMMIGTIYADAETCPDPAPFGAVRD